MSLCFRASRSIREFSTHDAHFVLPIVISHADEREEAFSHGERDVDAAREDGWDWRESCDHDDSIDGRRMPRTAGLDGRSGEAGDRGDGEIRGKWVEERRGQRLR